MPGHLDAKVYLRNDYRASDSSKQQNYAQVDGRVNRPLSLAVRLNDGTETNRAGDVVPPTQLTIRNGPSSNGNDAYGTPTFRVRAELKKDKVDLSPPGLAENVFTCRGEGYGIEIPAFLTVCLIVPTKTQGALARRRAEHGPALRRPDDDVEPGAHGRRRRRARSAAPTTPTCAASRRSTAAAGTSARARARRSCRRPACAWTTSRSA